MRPAVRAALVKVIGCHYNAVRTDTELQFIEDDRYFSLQKKSRQFWADYQEAWREVEAVLGSA